MEKCLILQLLLFQQKFNDCMYQYLLNIAQKILYKSAPHDVVIKYDKLKNNILKSHIAQAKNQSTAKKKLQNSRLRSSSCSKFSTNKKEASQVQKQSRKFIKKKLIYETSTDVLPELIRQLKLAQQNTTRLANFSISPIATSYFSLRTNQQLQQFCQIIRKIYQKLTGNTDNQCSSKYKSQCLCQLKSINNIPQRKNDSKEKIQHKQLIEDNKWLINKLQSLADENSVLRRMVGK